MTQSQVRVSTRLALATSIAAALLLTASVGFTEPQPTGGPTNTNQAAGGGFSPPAPAKPTKPKHGDPDEVVCKTTSVTGSRLGGERTCLKRKDWQATAHDARETLDATTRNQINPQQ